MLGFAYLGLVSALVQGGLIRRLVPKYGEPRLIVAGLVFSLVGFASLGFAWNTPTLLLAVLAVGLGQGMASPTITGLLSRLTPTTEQGAVFGTLTSAQTLARFVNYLAANYLLGKVAASAPFWEAAAIAAVTLILAALTIGPGLISKPALRPEFDLARSTE